MLNGESAGDEVKFMLSQVSEARPGAPGQFGRGLRVN
jgi:hypothetical protein